MPAKLTIGEAADLLGITVKTIRHYHNIGLLGEPERGPMGYRLYGVADLTRIRTILRLVKLGLSLKQVRVIMESDDPDALMRQALWRQRDILDDEIARLRSQQEAIASFLGAQASIMTPDSAPGPSARAIYDIMRGASQPLADTVLAVEGSALNALDQLDWQPAGDDFRERLAEMLAACLLPWEHRYILWMERYAALAHMLPDDRQARAWLGELADSRDRHILAGTFQLPPGPLDADAVSRVQQLLAQALFEDAGPLQRAFLAVIYPGVRR
jgi:DNA-binding transcriptional MerR regulator